MGTTSSKTRTPWAQGPPGTAYGQPYFPGQPFVPGQMTGMPPMQGYPVMQQAGIPGQPQAVIPGQLQFGMPVPMVMPQAGNTRRRSTRGRRKSQKSRTNHDAGGGFVPMLSQPIVQPEPEPVIPGQAASRAGSRRSRSHRESTSQRRTQTPFHRQPEIDEYEDETTSDDEPPETPRDTHRRSSQRARINPNLAELVQPLDSAAPEVFGPTDGRPSALPSMHNPLPSPPMDIYEMSPYKHILNLPTTEDLLIGRKTSVKLSRRGTRKKKGFLRGLFHPEPESSEPAIRFVPVNVNRTSQDEPAAAVVPAPAPVVPATTQTIPQSLPAVSGGVPIIQDPHYDPNHLHSSATVMPTPATAPSAGYPRLGPDPSMPFVPPPPGPVPLEPHRPLYFNHQSNLGWVNQSPFRVLYENRTYPTAAHLFEALRFGTARFGELYSSIPGEDHQGLREVSDRLARDVGEPPNVAQQFIDNMLIVLRTKFGQHPNLRNELLETGDEELLYDDPNDPFWGIGADGQGANYLGQALMATRDSLRQVYLQNR